jgi:potassium/hydrogen antiporter
MKLSIEVILIGLSILFFLSILAGKASSRFGVPALLLFLLIGMACGSDGLGIQFEDNHIAQTIGTIALCIILFSGGLDTKIADIRPIIGKGVLLATMGVLLTALISGVLIWWVLGKTMASAGIGLTISLLLAATMSSTDSASVFSILRGKGLQLKNNLRPTLELESGSNDPMAYVLVITMLEIVKLGQAPQYGAIIGSLLLQLSLGAVAGYAIGKLAVYVINNIRIGNDSLYPILVFTFSIFIFSATHFIKGNSYLAVYIGGMVIGNAKFVHKRSSLSFFDGLAWMSQLLMFLTLGLLVNPHELIPIIIPGLIISFVMIFIARPIAVHLCLLPYTKMAWRDKSYVAWVGLRGAVPIIFAIIPLAENVPNARDIFNIVFFCTLVSLLVQGTTLAPMARWLKLSEKPRKIIKPRSFDVEFSADTKSITTEIEIKGWHLEKGARIMNLPLPDKTLVVMVKRFDKFFIPTGNTVLQEADKLLVITDDHEALMETYRNLGIDYQG